MYARLEQPIIRLAEEDEGIILDQNQDDKFENFNNEQGNRLDDTDHIEPPMMYHEDTKTEPYRIEFDITDFVQSSSAYERCLHVSSNSPMPCFEIG